MKIKFLIILLLFLTTTAFAVNTSARFLKITSSAKIAAMGDAGIALDGADIGTTEKNPASLFWQIIDRIPEIEVIDPEVIAITDLNLEIDNPQIREFQRNADEINENDEYYVKNRRIKITLIRNEKRFLYKELAVLYFDFNQETIRDEYFEKLDKLAKFLSNKLDYSVLIEGYTDEIGEEEYNRVLASKRAGEVIKYLIEKNVPPETFNIVAYGKAQQLAFERTEGFSNIKLDKKHDSKLVGVQIIDKEGVSKVVDVFMESFMMMENSKSEVEEEKSLPENIDEIARSIQETAQKFKYGREKIKINKQKNKEFMMAHNEWFEGVNSDYVGYSQVLSDKNLALGGSIKYLKITDIKKRDSLGRDIGYFGSYDSAFNFTAAKTFFDHSLGLGATLKLVRESIDDNADSVLATDLGAIYKLNKTYSFGFSVLNLAKDGIKLYKEEFDLPKTYIFGVAKHTKQANFVFDIEQEINNDQFYKFGIEYFLIKNFDMRFGYKYSVEKYDDLGLSCGFGLKFFKNIEIDYAYVPFDELEDTHRFSLKFKF